MPSKPSFTLRRPPDPAQIEQFVRGPVAPAPRPEPLTTTTALDDAPLRLGLDLDRRLRQYCAARGVLREEVVGAAVERFLDGEEFPSFGQRLVTTIRRLRTVLFGSRAPAA